MIIFTKSIQLSRYLRPLDQPVFFVPTMGALHQGHISLLKQGTPNDHITVCSIFVNPTQFNNPDDLLKYPRTVEQDIRLLEENGCHILYLPSEADIYPNGSESVRQYALGEAALVLEGKFRSGHFQGVAQVVDRLLEIVQPDAVILGQKDLQQVTVISNMARQYHPQVRVITAPTVRDADGLALSSRNKRLNAAQRAAAPVIYQTLVSIQAKLGSAPFDIIRKESVDMLERKGLQVEYISLIDRENWQELEENNPNKKMAIVIAAYMGEVRLIDNLLL
ncbi:MAG: pantoate--beta-alanine ligase [Taibaiella sp.]|nr:pantoate--beta-alanine ligase [Taibaiella sp.]